MEAIKMIPAAVLALVIAGLVVGAGVKVLGNFKSSVCQYNYIDTHGICITCTPGDYTYNVSANNCYSAANTSNTTAYTNVANEEFNATRDTLKGTKELSGQFPTMGIVIAMTIILMMIGGLAMYFGVLQ